MAQQHPKVSISAFFSAKKPIEKVIVKRGQTDGRCMTNGDVSINMSKSHKRSSGLDYVEEFRKKLELEEVETADLNLPSTSLTKLETPPESAPEKSVLGVEGLSTLGVSRTAFEVDEEELTDVYTKYDFTPVQPKGLVIEQSKDEILRMVESNQVVIIEGATGCGKSTQVPQYILDQHASRKLPCNIIVTQPRRIAATSIAKWVCKDRQWELGSIVGYQIGLEIKSSPETRLLFCTTGVLLEKLIMLKDMNKYTHVILDEVHERNQDMDFLMLLVRKLLRSNSKNVKVILMSATFDTRKFSKYFAMQVNNMSEGAPIVEVKPLGQKYKISEFYLEDLEKRIQNLPVVELNDPCASVEARRVVVQMLRIYFDKIDQEDFKKQFGRPPGEGDHYRHCVLVFLPGLRDIEDMFNDLGGKDNADKWHLLPLHSSLPRDEQQRVFEPVRIGYRKVVLCTDIAESSVTVPDVKYVIDFCLTKELIADPLTNFTSLQLRWASRTNCKQRAGRTGRVMHGRVYRLVPQSFFLDVMYEDKHPEMLRCPLEIVVLKCKILDVGEPRAVLHLALDPPDISNIERAILLLKEAGALLSTCRGRPVRFDGDITFLGRIMASLPLNIQISKLIALGYLFSLLNDTIVIAGMLSVQNVFTTPFKEQIQAYESKLFWADGSCSDPVAYLNVYTIWKRYMRDGYFSSEARREKTFFKRYHINPKGLREASELVSEITKRLKEINIFSDTFEGAAEWSKDEKPLILKTLIAGAFYPNYFLRGAQGGQINEIDALKKVGGHDARRSVFLTGLPAEQPGMLYAKAVKKQLEDCGSQMRVFFEASKYIVEFDRYDKQRDYGQNSTGMSNEYDSTIPGGISMAVYRAVKRRLSKLPIFVDLLRIQAAKALADELGIVGEPVFLRNGESRPEENSNIPGPEVTDIEFVVSEAQDPGRFWIQLVRHRGVVERLFNTVNMPGNTCPLSKQVEEGDIVAAPYNGDYYRAKVIVVNRADASATVSFMDYGNAVKVKINSLLGVKDIPIALWNSPPYAIECRLCGIAPSSLKNRNNIWSAAATSYFRQISMGSDKLLKATVYSRVEDVLALTVQHIRQQEVEETDNSLNKMLVREGFAVDCVEDIRSRTDHDYRKKLTISRDGLIGCHKTYNFVPMEVEPPPLSDCYNQIILKGPYSPLEMSVYGCMNSTSTKCVRLDPQSVNSVLLDCNPEDVHERLLVGAVVAQCGEDRNNLLVRNTTLLPNIHGLPPLLALLFAPNVEIRTNIAETKYVGILCGLGYDPKDGSSLFPENDLCMTFDCVIDEDDLNLVNHIRLWMSHLMRTEEGETLPSISIGERRDGQLKLKSYLMQLLGKKRNSQELSFVTSKFQWKQVNQDKMLVPVENDERYIFKLVRRPELTTAEELLKHIRELVELIKLPPETPVNEACKLCNIRLTSVRAIATHINLKSHRDRENEEYGEK